MLIYELSNFNGPYELEAKQIRLQLKQQGKRDFRWIEWNDSIRSIVSAPDLTIVSARNMFSKSLKKIIQHASSRKVVLYGCVESDFDIPCFDGAIDIDILNEMMTDAIERDDGPAIQQQTRWLKTIPLPLQNMVGFNR